MSYTSKMDETIDAIKVLQSELTTDLDIGGMFSRNPIAHKWKECYRLWSLRELVSWRFCDLIYQAALLQKDKQSLGAGILLRSAIETIAVLIHSNIQMEKVLNLDISFWDSSRKTIRLLLGSRDDFTEHDAIGVLSIIDKCDKNRDYELREKYDYLSEHAHPNWDGMQKLYSRLDHDNHIEYFENCASKHFKSNPALIELLLVFFVTEYNNIWPKNFETFEKWLVKNNERLQTEKDVE